MATNCRGRAFALIGLAAGFAVSVASASGQAPTPAHPSADPATLFQTSAECLACHNGLTTTSGEDVSIGVAWRASMMANSSRDPYWQASVRRETIDNPTAKAEIEHECSICHMPMTTVPARALDQHGQIFAHLPIAANTAPTAPFAADGVSCTVCHQIGSERLGTRESFTGGFVIRTGADGPRQMFGPFAVDNGRTALMRSATGATPTEATHVRDSEVCATCHTLFTTALGAKGEPVGTLPEQVPYLEWRHSAFRAERSCQSCHMPAVAEPTPIASVLGEPREGLSRHTFLGGNFFMLRMLNRHRAELGVAALPQELESAAAGTVRQLQEVTGTVAVPRAERSGQQLSLAVDVTNLTGHKFPTGYPSRRAWLHVAVRDAAGRVIFESGAMEPSGAIRGNDNDNQPDRFEPHYSEIRRSEEVQIYESVMTDSGGTPSTALLKGVRYVKDNRLLPRGFNKETAEADIAVHGDARGDADFAAPGDRISYLVDTGGAPAPFQVTVELMYQPISFRWAQNLRGYDAAEPARFVTYFNAMAPSSAVTIARAEARVD
jgi:hypothetical protein